MTNWGLDPFSRGAYSYVAVGATGEDYDILGRPVANCLFFAGEATCKEHPDTVGGAMMSGLREAVRIMEILNTGKDYAAELEAMEAVQRRSENERIEVRDISRRLEAFKLSGVISKSSSERVEILRDMFAGARTTSGRLHLAKELLRLPVETLKSFAGTREGLTVLNSWILVSRLYMSSFMLLSSAYAISRVEFLCQTYFLLQDSLGKNATQLLRHCVRIIVLVSTNLQAVRLSG